MFTCLFAKRHNDRTHTQPRSVDMDVTRACLLPKLTEDKIGQNCPQAAIKLLSLRDIRRSDTRCLASVTHVTLRIFDSCLYNFESFKTVISYVISLFPYR
jgi:hypothetical protein